MEIRQFFVAVAMRCRFKWFLVLFLFVWICGIGFFLYTALEHDSLTRSKAEHVIVQQKVMLVVVAVLFMDAEVNLILRAKLRTSESLECRKCYNKKWHCSCSEICISSVERCIYLPETE